MRFDAFSWEVLDSESSNAIGSRTFTTGDMAQWAGSDSLTGSNDSFPTTSNPALKRPTTHLDSVLRLSTATVAFTLFTYLPTAPFSTVFY
ncbi:hypothetical protein BT69DRAFT_498331 [Atractiella rhizophila]|nr:hypothetical protein BT69DRAFT_498331 [Atractiella rhizophila]